MSDYVKMTEYIDSALKSLDSAEAEMLPVNAVKQLDAYLLAYLRVTKTCLTETRKAILSSSSYRKAKQKSGKSEAD